MVGWPAVISNLHFVLVNHAFPEISIPLHLASWVPLFAVGVEVSCEDSANLPNDSLPVHLSRRSLCHSRLRVFPIVTFDTPRNLFTSSPDVGSDYIVIGPSAHIRPLINHHATPLPYRRPNSVSFSSFIWRMADPNLSAFSRWLLQAHYVRPTFDSRLPQCNGPLV